MKALLQQLCFFSHLSIPSNFHKTRLSLSGALAAPNKYIL